MTAIVLHDRHSGARASLTGSRFRRPAQAGVISGAGTLEKRRFVAPFLPGPAAGIRRGRDIAATGVPDCGIIRFLIP